MRTPDQRGAQRLRRPPRPLRARAGGKTGIGRAPGRLHQSIPCRIGATRWGAVSRADTYGRARDASMRHQRQFPVLADEIAPEAVVRLLANKMKARRLVDGAGGDQHVVRPKRDLAVARPTGKADAFADQPPANGKAAGTGLHVEQAQFGDLVAVLDEQDRADNFAVALGDPAALAPDVEIVDERCGYSCHECLEAL